MGKFKFQPGFFLSLSIACVLLPFKWIIAWLVSIFVHEFGHYMALRITHSEVYGISVGVMGIRIDTAPGFGWKGALCAVAGPVCGFLLLGIARWCPRVAICGLLNSTINMLPLYPLDGGRALRCLLDYLREHHNSKIVTTIEDIVALMLYVLIIWLTTRFWLGPIPLLVLSFLLIRRKCSCKPHGQRVQ